MSVDFATSTLAVDTDSMEEVLREIERVEPEVKVEPAAEQRSSGQSAELDVRRQVALILLSVALFAAGFVLEGRLGGAVAGLLPAALLGSAYLLSGWRVLYTAARNIVHGRVFDEHFLMTVATVGAIAIHQMPEAAGVMIFYKVGEFLQELSVSRSRASVSALLAARPQTANLRVDGALKVVDPQTVQVGDVVVVKPGEKIPLDGEVLGGVSRVDTSALTGEPVPRRVAAGEEVHAGTINKTAVLAVRVNRPFEQSSIARVMHLVQNAVTRKARTERFITRFARVYTPVVVGLAAAVALLPPLLVPGATLGAWLYRALILLVISCPCALVVSIPLGYFGGIGAASRAGILVKGSNYLDALRAVTTVVFDKTGTLTEGSFRLLEAVPAAGFSHRELLELAAAAESHSNHPIAQSIVEACTGFHPPAVEAQEERPGRGVWVRCNGRVLIAGNDALLHDEGVSHSKQACAIQGTIVHVAADGRYAGYLVVGDRLKPEAAAAVRSLRSLGIRQLRMLTGDSAAAAEAVQRRLGLDAVAAELLPEQKVAALEEIKQRAGRQERVAFVGDGINDSPVIARADVGIAMGEFGSEAAIDIADVVLMNDSPLKVAEAVRLAGRTHRIVWQNVALAFLIKGAFVALGIAGAATMWEAVFADMGVALLAILNSRRAARAPRGGSPRGVPPGRRPRPGR